MAGPTFDLLHYIVDRLPTTKYDLASSNLPPVPVESGNVLLVLTNLHNPGGTRLGVDDLARLAEVAEQGDFPILMDEIFREAALDEPPPSALTVSDRFIVTSSVTKVYGLGGLRLGWCMAAPDFLAALHQAKDFTSVAPSLLSDAIGVRVLTDGEAVRRRNQRLMATNRRLVEEWIRTEPAVEWVPPDANVSFPRYRGDVDRLASMAFEEYGVLVAPGRMFGAPDHFRLCYGTDTATVTAGLEGLSQAIRET